MAVLKLAWRAALATALLIMMSPAYASAARIKDITAVEGVRSNQLSGYGVVLGLDGTGDGQQSLFTIQSILSMLRRRGVAITVDLRQIRVKNATAVAVTATLPPFARAGSKIDVRISSIGNGKVRLSMHDADFTTARRVAVAINESIGEEAAAVVDPGTIDVALAGGSEAEAMHMLASIERLEVELDRRARVIVNERTGTVIMGSEVPTPRSPSRTAASRSQ